jgi:hypothetical protein
MGLNLTTFITFMGSTLGDYLHSTNVVVPHQSGLLDEKFLTCLYPIPQQVIYLFHIN